MAYKIEFREVSTLMSPNLQWKCMVINDKKLILFEAIADTKKESISRVQTMIQTRMKSDTKLVAQITKNNVNRADALQQLSAALK